MNVRSAYTDTFTLAGFDGNFHGCTNGLVGGIAVSAKHSWVAASHTALRKVYRIPNTLLSVAVRRKFDTFLNFVNVLGDWDDKDHAIFYNFRHVFTIVPKLRIFFLFVKLSFFPLHFFCVSYMWDRQLYIEVNIHLFLFMFPEYFYLTGTCQQLPHLLFSYTDSFRTILPRLLQ